MTIDICIIFVNKFEIWSSSGFLTSGDLLWPRDTFHQKAEFKSVIMTYHLPTFNHFWNLTYFRNFWPRVTFVDLVTPFFEKLTSRASVWYICYHILSKFEICPFSWFLTTGDLCWPLFWKAGAKSVILVFNLPSINDFWNLTFFRNFWLRVSFVDLLTPFFEKLTSGGSLWYTIYSLSMTFEILPYMTPNL